MGGKSSSGTGGTSEVVGAGVALGDQCLLCSLNRALL
jgi:hypothetical protein